MRNPARSFHYKIVSSGGRAFATLTYMNPGLVIKQLESFIRARHRIQGSFKVNFYYQYFSVWVVGLGPDKTRIISDPEKFCEITAEQELKVFYPVDIEKLLKAFTEQYNLATQKMSRDELGLTLTNCLNYYYLQHATIPTSLY